MERGPAAGRPNRGYACAVSLIERPGHTLLVSGAWHSERSADWGKPVKVGGLVAGGTPNADVAAGWRLTLRTAKPTRQIAPDPSVDPSVSREIGATGWAGGFKLYGTLAVAIRRFGKPAGQIPNGLGCQVSWPKLGLSAVFSFGSIPCGSNGRAMSLSGSGTWSTSRGLRVGTPEADVARLYPGATQTTSSAGVTTWYLVPHVPRAGGMSLTVQSVKGRVTTITVATGASTFGMVVWGS